MPLVLQDRHHDADDEQVVGVGEEAHAGDEHDLPVLTGDAGIVHPRQQVVMIGRAIAHRAVPVLFDREGPPGEMGSRKDETAVPSRG